MVQLLKFCLVISLLCTFTTHPTNAQPLSYPKKESLGSNINTTHSEIKPVISPDGKTLYFTRKGDPVNIGYGEKPENQDVWVSQLMPDGTWGKAINMGEPINNVHNNNLNSISPDGNAIILSNRYFRDGSEKGGVSISYRTSGGWSFPEPMTIKEFVNKNKFVDFFLANDRKELLMAIENENSFGVRDIFVSFLSEDNTWTKPMNLGTDINTTQADASPFLASDGVTLYFASEGHGGVGGRDLFVSRRLDDSWTHWSKPENLGANINTPGFDSYYSISAKGDYAYLSSYDSVNSDDIYRISLQKSAQPNPVILISGHTYNQKTKNPIGAKILYEILPDAKEAGIALSNDKDGAYKIVLPVGKNFGFRAETKGFYSVNENLDCTNITEYKEITKDLYLAPIEVDQTIRLNNIFFETAKSDLKPESFAELDRVVKFLKDNDNIHIAIKGHTDNVGADDYNLTLSDNRAKSVMTYVVGKGIDASRITSKGYGKTVPIATNETDEGRQLNRRVEFTIIKN